jgi:acyl-CoA synthetase (AMP-forming)/AMP-acid ligase II
MLGHPAFGTRDLRSLRTGSIGAAPVPVEIMRRILDRERGLGMDALVVYGLTEATGGTHWTRPGDPLERRVSTVGLRTAEIEDRVADPATGEELPPGQEGELCIKGPTLMIGYYNKPEATAEKIRDGWLHTGDMAVWDEENYIHIVDRKKDIIISGGENISSIEVEKAIFAHPAVFECAVVSAPDPRWGEIPVAIVVLKEGQKLSAEELLQFLDPRIAKFKMPRRIEFSKDPLPKTGTGKIVKRALREEFWKGKDKRVQG